jgi:hypothetical protein
MFPMYYVFLMKEFIIILSLLEYYYLESLINVLYVLHWTRLQINNMKKMFL